MTTSPKQSEYDNSALTAEDEGYHKGLKPRQLQMIAIGGAIGTGLFLGAGGRLHNAGPGLFLSYAFCGIFVFLILRALGELVLHRPSSGSFVSYAREFLGEKAAFVAGWWTNLAVAGVVGIMGGRRVARNYEDPRLGKIAGTAVGLWVGLGAALGQQQRNSLRQKGQQWWSVISTPIQQRKRLVPSVRRVARRSWSLVT